MTASADLTLKQAGAALYAGQFAQALTLAQPLADSPQPRVAATALHVVSLALTRLGRTEEAESASRRLLERDPANAPAWVNLSTAQEAAGRTDEAIDSLTRALQIDPDRAPAHFNLGLLYVKRQDWTQAERSFARAIELAPDRPEPYCQRAEALIRLNRCVEAQHVLQVVLKRHPLLALGWSLMGAAHQKLGQTPQALACYRKAQTLTDNRAAQAAAFANMATLIKNQDINLALQHARRAVELEPDFPGVQAILASLLIDDGQADAAYQAAQRERDQHGDNPFALSLLTRVSSERCDWRMGDDQLAALRQALQGETADTACGFINPFVMLRFPFSLAELQRITQAHTARAFAQPQSVTAEMRARHVGKPRPQRLRIGYFSADFHNHATMFLMAGFFEAHDKSRFETIGICHGHYSDEPDDTMRARAKQTFDRFISVADKTDLEIAELARELDIHIAVDLKGFTLSNRLGAFVQRAAPIQMHYLGYPGTLGMPGVIDYLVADPVLIPQASRPFYSEKIIELPDSYQVNDRQRASDPVVPSRLELGLPEDAFVFCCFNNNYKITPEVFGLWMQLLQDLPSSVLWLLADNDAAARNLKQAAQDAGIDPGRIIFAQRASLSQHLARQARADLFLDTWPYNAHTTASDALWVGLPVLTCMGETFASRVGASLLTACNLPELITDTPQNYLARAKALAHDPQQLGAIRRKLQDTRLTVPLFDTARFTRHLETAYDLAWERFTQGLPPEHITVPSMS
jgi:predicted O-linked N-acetylglucosamine transferase (SPINDLY family)